MKKNVHDHVRNINSSTIASKLQLMMNVIHDSLKVPHLLRHSPGQIPYAL